MKLQNPSLRKRKGFTLIELIVVIAILAILAAIAIP
ncbi:MAG: prepilin-type N-terminal cleavage/methylation domain-containing protein, partial [Eubacteriales bacterium]|nr:prepilin-type N-terminal cleavage/methylation domain-containing protein [Eubacteriales bacterium]